MMLPNPMNCLSKKEISLSSWENIEKNQVNFTDDLSGFQNMSLRGDEINDRFDDTDGYEDDFS